MAAASGSKLPRAGPGQRPFVLVRLSYRCTAPDRGQGLPTHDPKTRKSLLYIYASLSLQLFTASSLVLVSNPDWESSITTHEGKERNRAEVVGGLAKRKRENHHRNKDNIHKRARNEATYTLCLILILILIPLMKAFCVLNTPDIFTIMWIIISWLVPPSSHNPLSHLLQPLLFIQPNFNGEAK